MGGGPRLALLRGAGCGAVGPSNPGAGGGIGTGKSGIDPTDDIVECLEDIDIIGEVTSGDEASSCGILARR